MSARLFGSWTGGTRHRLCPDEPPAQGRKTGDPRRLPTARTPGIPRPRSGAASPPSAGFPGAHPRSQQWTARCDSGGSAVTPPADGGDACSNFCSNGANTTPPGGYRPPVLRIFARTGESGSLSGPRRVPQRVRLVTGRDPGAVRGRGVAGRARDASAGAGAALTPRLPGGWGNLTPPVGPEALRSRPFTPRDRGRDGGRAMLEAHQPPFSRCGFRSLHLRKHRKPDARGKNHAPPDPIVTEP
jgi:hypothetical protein